MRSPLDVLRRLGRGSPRPARRRVTTLAVSALLALGTAALISPSPAVADTPVSAYSGAGLTVTAYTGAKNYSNHTQWVGSLYVLDTAGWLCDRGDPTEAWAGSVWYGQATGCSRGDLFTVNRWVPSGSGVCGAYWRWKEFPGQFPWSAHDFKRFRFVACITISV